MTISKNNFKDKIIELGENYKSTLKKRPTLSSDWGVDPYIPFSIIREFEVIKNLINFTTRGSVIMSNDILNSLEEMFVDDMNGLTADYISILEETIGDEDLTDEEIQSDITLYYNTFKNGDEFQYGYISPTILEKIYKAFVDNKCYAFKYDW